MKELLVGRLSVQIMSANLATVGADAIVCPSNSHGHMRGGVAQAIRLAGGDEIEEMVRKMAPIALGRAVITPGFALPARYVIHAPTMRDPVEKCTPQRIRWAMQAALTLARREGLNVIAIPGLGTGTGEVSLDVAATTIMSEVERICNAPEPLRVVKLVAFSERLEIAFLSAAQAVSDKISQA